mgnify:CR=1 FL=1
MRKAQGKKSESRQLKVSTATSPHGTLVHYESILALLFVNQYDIHSAFSGLVFNSFSKKMIIRYLLINLTNF